MGKIDRTVSGINRWAAFGDHVSNAVVALGGPKIVAVASAILVAGWGALVSWLDQLPFWGISAATLLLVGLTLFAYAALRRAWAVRGIRKIDLSTVADACLEFEQQYRNFLDDNAPKIQEYRALHNSANGSAGENWAKAHAIDDELSARMRDRLGGELAAVIAQCSALGIKVDSDFRSLHWSSRVARHVGGLGRLLKGGLLEEARSLDRYSLFY